MANQIIPLSLANTFGDWVVTTNKTLAETNDLQSNNYTKDTGTLVIQSPGTGIQVANNALIQGVLTVSGVGSSATIQNSMSVLGQLFLSNSTGVGLVVTNTANIANVNIIGAGVGLFVANNTLMNGTLNVGGNVVIDNNVHITGRTTSSVSATAGVLTANTVLNAGSANIVGTLTSATTLSGVLTANTVLNAGSANIVGTLTAGVVSANINSTLVLSGVLTANTVLNAGSANIVGTMTSGAVTAGVITGTTGNFGDVSVSNNFVINGTTIYDSLTLNLKGAAPITGVQVASFGVNRQAGIGTFTPNAQILFDNGTKMWSLRDIAGANANASFVIVTEKYTANLTNAGLVQLSNANTSLDITQALTLAGANLLSNFIVSTGAGANSVTNSSIAANVSTINGSIAANVATINGSITANAASANSVINTRVSANSAADRAYTDSNITANVATINGSIAANVTTINGSIAANVATINGSITANATSVTNSVNTTTDAKITANVATINGSIAANATSVTNSVNTTTDAKITANIAVITTFSQSAFNRANSSVSSVTGTSGSAAPSSGVLTLNSGNGVTATGSGSTVTINTPQDVRTTASPTFANTQLTALGVGTAASANTGEIRATGDVTAFFSDDRLKTRLGPIENALDKLMSLSGFYFEPNETAVGLGYAVSRQVGVSAQEVQAVLPEIVVPAPIDDKYLTVKYERLAPLIIEAIKELKIQIDEIKLGLK